MSTKTVFPGVLMLVMAGVGAAQAADLPTPSPVPGTYSVAVPLGNSDSPPPASPTPPGRISDWVAYSKCDCCGPIGADGPIRMEIFARTGPSFVVGSGILSDRIDTGWMIQAGGRSLFFNPDHDSAFTAELSLGYIYNNGNHPLDSFPLASAFVPGSPASVSTLNRTFGSLNLGWEWYLWGDGFSADGPRWRVGFDGGIRYGTTRLDLHDFSGTNPTTVFSQYIRLNKWDYGPSVSLHSDFEYPCGCCTFMAGLRLEWDDFYQNQIVFQTNNDSVADINLLLTLGVRY